MAPDPPPRDRSDGQPPIIPPPPPPPPPPTSRTPDYPPPPPAAGRPPQAPPQAPPPQAYPDHGAPPAPGGYEQPAGYQQPVGYQQPGGYQPGGYQQYPYPQTQKKSGGAAKGCLIAALVVAGIGALLAVLLFVVLGVGIHKVAKEVDKYVNKKTVEVPVGRPGASGDLQVTVIGSTPWSGDATQGTTPGNEFIALDVQLRNTGMTLKVVVPMSDMFVQTASGQKYTPLMAGPSPEFPAGDIAGGENVRGMLAFEIPSGTNDLYFVFNQLLSTGDIIKVKVR